MPPGFAFPAKDSEFWAPLAVNERAKRRVGYWLQMVARLKPGITPEHAQSEMDVVGRQLEQQYPDDNAGYGVYVNPLENHVAGRLKTPLLVLLGAVGFVLLIACVNVAGLFLTRAEARRREIMVRAAMGASRAGLIRQLFLEAGALAVIAGAAGILAAQAGIRVLLWLAPRNLPRLDEIRIDGAVLLFALGLTTLTTLLFGLWPAWRLSLVNLREGLSEGGRGMAGSRAAARVRSGLVVVECALAILLLAGAGLLLRSLAALRGTNIGLRTDDVLTMRVNASRTRNPQGPQLAQFYDQLLERVRALPGVRSAGAISDLFLSDTPSSGTFTLEDRAPFPPAEQIEATTDVVTPGFFETMQVRLIRGRFLDTRDKDGAPRTVVINESFARKYWPNQNPVGKHMVFGTPGPRNPWITIVGVIGDMRRRGLHQGARLETFLSTGQNGGRNLQLLIVTDRNPLALAPAVRAEIRKLDASAPITAVSTVEAEIGESLAVRRFQALLLGLFSILAVLLAAVGIFGLMSQLVVRRTAEIGLRMALGASPRDVLKLILRQGSVLAMIGAVAGVCGAYVLGRVLDSLLFGISAADPVSYAGAAIVLAIAVLLACGLPAWRAARVDPMVALRHE
jgi:putative ABC transport system permease protein